MKVERGGHHRFGAGGLDGGDLRPPGQPGAARLRGAPDGRRTRPGHPAAGTTQPDHGGRELPRWPFADTPPSARSPNRPAARQVRQGRPLLRGQAGPPRQARRQRPRDDAVGRQQAVNFGTRIITDDIVRVDFSQRPFTLSLARGQTVQAKAVIVATGRGPTTSACRRRTASRTTASRRAPSATGRCRASAKPWSSSAAATRPSRRRPT